VAHYIRLTTSSGDTTETRIVPGLRGGDRVINHARQLAVAWGLENGSKVVAFTVEDAEGKTVGEGTVVPPVG
jgi:nitrous oxide reductase